MSQIIILLIYLIILIIPLKLYSIKFNKNKQIKNLDLIKNSQWFDKHIPRSTYITLLQSTNDELILKSALICRAVEDVKRIWKIRDDKLALVTLIQRGQVGDDLLQQIQSAEKELESEIVEVVSEANTYRLGWGQGIFQSASEIAQHQKLKKTHQNLVKQA